MLDLTFCCSSLPAPFNAGQSSSGRAGWAITQTDPDLHGFSLTMEQGELWATFDHG
jgi:hypothetical protein